ncbi:helix-turn-helix domain-containing protein [Pleurocapsales cyanobacterium LEGE 10410]|nr:helix-turn-helix domain-containing protein [Pleurocapsales cyanobacterium LEGE 10410]
MNTILKKSGDRESNNSSLDVVEFDSQSLEQDNVFEFWREGIRPLILGETKQDHDVNYLYHKLVKLDQIVVCKGGFSSQLFIRDRKHLLRHDDSDHIMMQWFAQGGCNVHNGGRNFIESPENIVLVDLGYETFSSTIAPFSELITVIMPRELLQEYWGSIDNLAGLSLPVNSTKGALLKNFMVSLCEELDTIKPADASIVAQATTHMVSSMFQDKFKQIDATEGIVEVELRLLIKDFIAANLRNPQLSIDMLVKKFNCSRATLYRMFQTQGGVANYINRLRLQRCYKHLVSGNVKRSQITRIAQFWGFSNRQQFTRQFKQYFGISPTDVVASGVNNLTRRFSDNPNSNKIDTNSYRLASWFKSLGHTATS